MTADRTRRLIIFPSGTLEISTHDTFDGKDICLSDKHRAATQFGRAAYRRRHLVNVGGDQMIRSDAAQLIEPEGRYRRKHGAFALDRCWQNAIESRDTVGRDEQIF